jgi:integrase
MRATPLRPTTPVEANDAFVSYLKRRGRADATIICYRPILDGFAEWASNKRLAEITSADIDFSFIPWWQEQFESRNKRQPSSQTLRGVHTALTSLYRFLTNYAFLVDENGKAVSNPMLAVDPPKVVRRKNDWLRRTEDETLLDTPMDAHEEIIIWMFRWTGLRLSEALSLRVSDVDLIAKTIHVTTSKTDNGIRQVPIAPELLPRLKAWLNHLGRLGLDKQSGYFLCTTRNGHWKDAKTGLVMTSEPGSPMKPQTVQQIVRKVGTRAGIERLTPHRLRRTFGSFFLNEGVRLEAVSKLLGHGDTRVTEQSYAQLMNETIRTEMMKALGA